MHQPNIQSLLKKIKKLENIAYKDPLLQIYNRRGFLDLAKKFIKELSKNKNINTERRKDFLIKECALIVFDVDNLKKLMTLLAIILEIKF